MNLPNLPKFLKDKIYKTGQTRGANSNVVYQNRVLRSSTVLIQYSVYHPIKYNMQFENGFIVLISPDTYFETPNIENILKEKKLEVGRNALVFYETRAHWDTYNPESYHWYPAENRVAPLRGNYVARVPATTAKNSSSIIRGFCTTKNKGAGIRVYEYANSDTIELCKLQLEIIVWHCSDIEVSLTKNQMSKKDITLRKNGIENICIQKGLLDYDKLTEARIFNSNKKAICPLCLEEISAQDFFKKIDQADGRSVPDITATQLNLFHINELRTGEFNHSPYNIGWGHHHCNITVTDNGIHKTLEWMKEIVAKSSLYHSFSLF